MKKLVKKCITEVLSQGSHHARDFLCRIPGQFAEGAPCAPGPFLSAISTLKHYTITADTFSVNPKAVSAEVSGHKIRLLRSLHSSYPSSISKTLSLITKINVLLPPHPKVLKHLDSSVSSEYHSSVLAPVYQVGVIACEFFIVQLYSSYLEVHGALDYDDLIVKATLMMERLPKSHVSGIKE